MLSGATRGTSMAEAAMLELNDPLWQKLDDAFGDRGIPELLSRLAREWDQEEALSLFWDCLCHQQTCYGATYAAVPHLLKIAQPDANRSQRREIAVLLGFVVFCSFGREYDSIAERDEAFLLAANQGERLRHCNGMLKTGPADTAELEKLCSIRQDFIKAFPEIRALCERALLENPDDENAKLHLLSGVAAADGLHDLASVLSCGEEGWFKCPTCDWGYEYILFGDRVALYADEDKAGAGDKAVADYTDASPSRADGFMIPIEPNGAVSDARAAALLDLAKRAASPQAVLLGRAFLGRFRCCKCGVEGTVKAVLS
jgi:hypothetical protein